MKFIKVLIFLLISASSYGQFYTNINTSIYWKQPSGFDKVFIGNDTFQITDNSKRWIAIKNAVMYFHDGTKWTAISGGGGSGGSYTLPAASPTVLGGIKYSTDFYLNTLAQLAIDTSKRNLWNQVALLPFYAKIDSVRKWLNDTANAHDYVFGSDFTVTGRNVSVNFPAQLTDTYGSSIWPGLTDKPTYWDAKTDYSEFLDSINSLRAIRRDSIFFNRADFLGSGTSLSPISLASNTDVSSTETGLIKPGYVTWSGTGYTYDVTPAIYRVNGFYYTSAAGSVTLDAADGALNRIDAVVVDTFGVVSKITGVAASNPVAPIPNPSSQVLLTNITVTPGSSAPSTLNTIVYNEEGNGEYIGSSSGVTSNTANTTFPFSGAKSDNIGAWTSGSTVAFTNGTTASATSYTYLKFFIRLKGIVQNATSISVIFYNGTTPVSKLVSIVNYGINKSLVGSYQNVSVPFSVFGFTSNQFNKIQFRFGGPDGPGCYLDFIQLQNSAVTETGSNALTDVYIQNGNLYKTVGGNSLLVGAVGGSGGGSTDTSFLRRDINLNTTGVSTKVDKTFGTQGSILFRGAAGISQSNNKFFYDSANVRLNINGATTPNRLNILSAANAREGITVTNTSNGDVGMSEIRLINDLGKVGALQQGSSGYNGLAAINRTLLASTGSISIASNADISNSGLDSVNIYAGGLNTTPVAVFKPSGNVYIRDTVFAKFLSVGGTTTGGGISYTDAQARAAISLTTSGSSGAATYNSSTGVINVPQYSGGSSSTSPFLNLADYGGLGDSSTDNSTALTSAIAALPAKGGIIYIGAGVYKVNSTVTVNKPVTFMGAGSGVFVLGYMPSATKILTTSTTIDVFNVTSPNVQFKDLNIENTNNTTSPLPTAGSGIKITTGNGFKLVNIMINGFYNDVEVVSAYHWLMTGCTISGYANYGVHVQDVAVPDAGDQAISNCWFFPKGRNAVASIFQENGGGLKVTNTKFNFDWNDGTTKYRAQYHYNSNFSGAVTADLLFSNCSFENYSTGAIRLIPNTSFLGNVTINGNQFSGLSSSAITDIFIQNVSGVSVTGNTFTATAAASTAVSLTSVTNAQVINSYFNYTTPKVFNSSTNNLEGGVWGYNNNNFGFAANIQNTNTGNSAFSGMAFNNSSGATKGQILYAPTNYIDANLQNTFMVSSLGTSKLAFVSDAGNTSHPDIYFKSGNSTNAIQVVGTTNFVGINSVTSNSNLQVAGSFALPYVAKTAAYTVTASDYTVDCNGTFTVTLPTAASITGRIYTIANTGSGAITVSSTSAITATTVAAGSSNQYQSTGSAWIKIN